VTSADDKKVGIGMRLLLMVSLLVAPILGWAEDDVSAPLVNGELYDTMTGANTAYTLSRGVFAYHPFFKYSAVGITDSMDVKFPTLGLIRGVGAYVEYVLVRRDHLVVSVEPGFGTKWGFKKYMGSTSLRLTHDVINVGIGGQYTSDQGVLFLADGNPVGDTDDVAAMDIPIDLGIDLPLDNGAILTLSTHLRPVEIITQPGFYAIVHLGWTRAFWKRFRASLGVNVDINMLDPQTRRVTTALGVLPDPIVLNIVHAQVWYRCGKIRQPKRPPPPSGAGSAR
jgi:hypothetical protein